MTQSLFNEDEFLVKDDSPEDDTEVKQTPLYYSQHQLKEFKRLSKDAMKIHWPETFQSEGNISEMVLTALKFYKDAHDNS